jgi:hypothetical protein
MFVEGVLLDVTSRVLKQGTTKETVVHHIDLYDDTAKTVSCEIFGTVQLPGKMGRLRGIVQKVKPNEFNTDGIALILKEVQVLEASPASRASVPPSVPEPPKR